MDAVAIVIDVGEAADASLEDAMVDACSAAVVEGKCGAAGRDAGGAEARATVRWDGEHLAADIEVVPFEGGARSHAMHFVAQDPMVERWRSVGLIVATLVGDARRAREAAHLDPGRLEPPPPPPRASPVPPTLPPAPESVRERVALDAGMIVGNGLEGGSPRVGVELAGSFLIPSTPLLPVVNASFAARPPDDQGVSARWVTLGAGLGLRAGLVGRTLALEARVEGIAEWTGASVTDGAGRGDSGGRWQPGVRAGVDVAWMFTRYVGVIAGVDGDIVPSGTVVHVHGTPLDRSPPEHVAALVGIRFGLY
jgi:hypothetical protein